MVLVIKCTIFFFILDFFQRLVAQGPVSKYLFSHFPHNAHEGQTEITKKELVEIFFAVTKIFAKFEMIHL